MTKLTKLLAALATAGVALMCASPVSAQATRTWVSGVGDDANPCSRTAPCKTFAGAISKTSASGEINCLDPGGFGGLTITKAISIICQAGTAGVLVAGTNGFTVSAGTTDDVYLSGLDFEGINSGLVGIQVNQAASVHVVNTIIRGFNNGGIVVSPSTGGAEVNVIDSVIADNLGVNANGILAKPTGSASVRMFIDRTRVSDNGGDGIAANGNVTTGGVKITVRDSESSNNTSNGYSAYSSSGAAQQLIDSSTAFNNNAGLATNGTLPVIRFTRMVINGNTTGVAGTVTSALSYGTNSIDGNANLGTFGTTPQQ